jgi:SPP1 family predicted phage head-tail adaptor
MGCVLTAGAKNQPIAIQRKTREPDMAGGFTETWTTIANAWAHVKPRSGRETMEEGRTNATFVVVFTIYRTTIRDTDRIMWQGVPYNIRGILDAGETSLDMMIEAERGVAS